LYNVWCGYGYVGIQVGDNSRKKQKFKHSCKFVKENKPGSRICGKESYEVISNFYHIGVPYFRSIWFHYRVAEKKSDTDILQWNV
jgi:hypothetical protein